MTINQLILLFIIIMILMYLWHNNKRYNVVDKEAKVPYYSDNNLYKYITPMKHDIFKQLTIDVVPLLLLGIVSFKDLISISNFENSVLGKSLLSGVGYAIFYQHVQPYIVNRLPRF